MGRTSLMDKIRRGGKIPPTVRVSPPPIRIKRGDRPPVSRGEGGPRKIRRSRPIESTNRRRIPFIIAPVGSIKRINLSRRTKRFSSCSPLPRRSGRTVRRSLRRRRFCGRIFFFSSRITTKRERCAISWSKRRRHRSRQPTRTITSDSGPITTISRRARLSIFKRRSIRRTRGIFVTPLIIISRGTNGNARIS